MYEKYEKQFPQLETIKARDLMSKIIEAQIETGQPYMLYKDSINNKSNQKNIGVIKSSNLCAEIVEYSDKSETSVCNLASIALPKFIKKSKITKSPEIELEEVGVPHKLRWDKCKLETISFGHGITTTPLQATSIYSALVNGGRLVKTNLVARKNNVKYKRLVSEETSKNLNNILEIIR